MGNVGEKQHSVRRIRFYCEITTLIRVFRLTWLCLDLAMILNMLMHGAVQSYLIKRIIIPKRSQTGSGGVAAFSFLWLSEALRATTSVVTVSMFCTVDKTKHYLLF